MKILLIQPAKSPKTIGGDGIFLYEPLALEYVASGVQGNHDVRILDLRLDNNLQKELEEFSPNLVGVTAYTVHVKAAKRLMAQVKQWNRHTVTVVGGHHATIMPQDFVSPSIDIIVIGEGVFTFREITERIEKGLELDNIPGSAISKEGQLVRAKSLPHAELDSLPFPNRQLTSKYRGHYYSEWMKPLTTIRTSKGCPYRCDFCALWKLTDGRYLKRDPKSILQELATIDEECIFFADDESLIDSKRMNTLAELIKRNGIKKRYFLYARSDTIVKNQDLIALWRDVGLERIFIGLESYQNRDLDFIKKNTSEEDNIKAVRILNSLDIDIYASFIIRPEYEIEDFNNVAAYCNKLGLSYGSFAVLTPLPGTDLYERVKDQLIMQDYDCYDLIHTLMPTKLPLDEFYSRLSWLYSGAFSINKRLKLLRKYSFRDIPSVILNLRKMLKRVKSAHYDYGKI